MNDSSRTFIKKLLLKRRTELDKEEHEIHKALQELDSREQDPETWIDPKVAAILPPAPGKGTKVFDHDEVLLTLRGGPLFFKDIFMGVVNLASNSPKLSMHVTKTRLYQVLAELKSKGLIRQEAKGGPYELVISRKSRKKK